MEIQTTTSEGDAALLIDQNDTDQACQRFECTTSSSDPSTGNYTATSFVGTGGVAGPGGNDYAIALMAMEEWNGTVYYAPKYTVIP